MKPTLTLEFETLSEMSNFLAGSEIPVPVEMHPTPTPLAVVETAAPVEAIIDPLGDAPLPEIDLDVDVDDLKAELMGKLKALANSMDDPAVLGKFINGFGVARFSEIPDKDLVSFSAALESEFGV